jgi:gag-polypeptide of LTR copia-type
MSLNWSKFDIEKFDDTTSFVLWQVRMKVILLNLGVRAVITGQPEELEGEENSKEWAAMDEKALSTIQLCVSDSTLQEILTKTTTGTWNKLEETFLKNTITNRLRLK